MNSHKPYLIVFLALTTLGGAALAWHQYQELVGLRAAAMNKDERADLQKRVAALEKLNRELQDQLAAFRLGSADAMDAVASTAGDAPTGDRGGRGSRGGPPGWGGNMQQFNAIRDLMAKPEVQAMVSAQQKAAIDARYAALFKNLNLQPGQLDKVTSLLAERQTTMMDVMAAAREQGVDPRTDPEGFRKLITDARNEVNNNIKSVLGDAGYEQLQNFEQTQPQRNLVNDLQQRLSYTNTPLTPAQADQLVQILATTAPQRPANTGPTGQPQEQLGVRGPDAGFGGGVPGGGFGGRGPGDMGGMVMGALGGGFGGGFPPGGGDGGRGGPTVAPVTPAAVAQAQTVLAPPQLAVLQQVQQQQQTQQQLQQLVRETLAASQPANSGATKSGGTTTGGTSTGTPARRRGGGN